MESKKEIYDLLPLGTYPQTVIKRAEDRSSVTDIIRSANLSFPVIAKPDIGLRGMGVALLKNEQDAIDYNNEIRVDYLLQELISYSNEIGIFYYRLPGEATGKITGIVGKAFLKVAGDGQSTILELLQKKARYRLQIPALKLKYNEGLSEVLKTGEDRLLVPFGNHSRGAKFIDLTHQLNEGLSNTFNDLCVQIQGFYFGRLDVKYDNWNDLCAGKNFSIIELNGAGSEPAHIYDPNHSIFFAWKEIIRHLGYLYQVSKRNRQIKNTPYLTMKEGLKMFRDNSEQVEKIA